MNKWGVSLIGGILSFLLISTACDNTLDSELPSPQENTSSIEQLVTNARVPQKATLKKALAEVRSATAMYQNLKRAKADGYAQFSIHVPNMGIHYLNGSVINPDATSNLDNTLDPTDPEILLYVDDNMKSPQKRLVSVEYAIPKTTEEPPSHALDLFPGLEHHDWHVHPSSHDFPMLSNEWTIHGECHYMGGLGVFLAENPDGEYVLWTPPTGTIGSWSGTIEPSQCPSSLEATPLPPLLLAHGKWWTLHVWTWYPNPEGVFHPTNPRIE